MVREHKRSEDGEFCRYCGANYVGGTFGTEATCLAREETRESYEIMPEPKRREIACEDADAISARMKEIAADRLKAINTIVDEFDTSLPSEPQYGDYCGD